MGIVFAVLFISWRMPKWVIIAATSFSGAMTVVGGFLVLFGGVPVVAASAPAFRAVVYNSWWMTLIWLGLALAGMIAQIKASKIEEIMTRAYMEETMREIGLVEIK